MADKIAVSQRFALRMMYDAGHDTPTRLTAAHERLKTLVEPTPGYVYADHVTKLIDTMKKESSL
jgi:hypothetical protein